MPIQKDKNIIILIHLNNYKWFTITLMIYKLEIIQIIILNIKQIKILKY